ncbi:eukaryotic translation initiation factor 3 subunit A-like protein, partial [Corchorus capsularis]
MIYPPLEKASKLAEILPGLGEVVDKEHKRLLARKSIIEKRMEEQERQLLEMEREEESKRLRLQKITEEAEQKRLAAEFEQRRAERIRQEIEERELEKTHALLEETGKRLRKGGKKKPVLEG